MNEENKNLIQIISFLAVFLIVGGVFIASSFDEDFIDPFLESHRLLVILVGSCIILGPFVLPEIFSSDRKLERKINREIKERGKIERAEWAEKMAKEKREREQEERELRESREKAAREGAERKTQDLIQQIRLSPRYTLWRDGVKAKYGNICQKDISHKNRPVEVHHLKSIYSIVMEYNITSMEKAFLCKPLWDLENGITLCKECHDTMESSQNRQTLMSEK